MQFQQYPLPFFTSVFFSPRKVSPYLAVQIVYLASNNLDTASRSITDSHMAQPKQHDYKNTYIPRASPERMAAGCKK